jgi:hypothetical protein
VSITTYLFELTEDIIEAIRQRDWEGVVRDTVCLYRDAQSSRYRELREAARDTMAAALFLLENPVYEQCCVSLARVMIAQLEDCWTD